MKLLSKRFAVVAFTVVLSIMAVGIASAEDVAPFGPQTGTPCKHPAQNRTSHCKSDLGQEEEPVT